MLDMIAKKMATELMVLTLETKRKEKKEFGLFYYIW